MPQGGRRESRKKKPGFGSKKMGFLRDTLSLKGHRAARWRHLADKVEKLAEVQGSLEKGLGTSGSPSQGEMDDRSLGFDFTGTYLVMSTALHSVSPLEGQPGKLLLPFSAQGLTCLFLFYSRFYLFI